MPSIKDFTSKERLNPEIMSELERIEEEKKTDRSKLVYKEYNKTFDFRKFKTIRAFGNDIRTNFINMYTANNEQDLLTKYIKEFKSITRPQYDSKRKSKKWKRKSKRRRIKQSNDTSSSAVNYNSFGYNTYKLSKNLKDVSLETSLSDLDDTDDKLFTPTKKRKRT